MLNEHLYSSNKDDWETPKKLFNKITEKFPPLDLDVCASEANAKCVRYFTKEIDGLAQDWQGSKCWCNPPYGKGIDKWVAKAYHESRKQETLVLALLPCRTDTRWFQNFVMKAAKLFLLDKRLSFEGSSNKAPFPACLALFVPFECGPPLLESFAV